MRDPRRELLDRQRHERLARVEVEDDVGGAGGHVGERLGPGGPPRACRRLRRGSSTTAATAADEERERGEQQRGAAAEHRRHGSARPRLGPSGRRRDR